MSTTGRAASAPSKPRIRPIEQLPWYHQLVVNWLITDPNQFSKQAHKSITKNYQVQNYKGSRYLFIFGGRWRTLKSKPIHVAATIILLVPAIVFWATEARWWWTRYSPSVVILFTYVWGLCFNFFINSAVSDPGIVPRNIHIPGDLGGGLTEDDSFTKVIHPPMEYFNVITLPHKGDAVKGVIVKYCTTCHIWRPPRCHHCSQCNFCVLNHDHHCLYLNNCIGTRNSKTFYWFLLTSTIAASFLVALLFLHMFAYRYTRFRTAEEKHGIHITTFKQSITKYPVTLFLVIFTIPAVIYPLLLLIFHLFLTAQNLTTREYLNDVRSSDTFVNIYDTGSILRNLYVNWIGKAHGISLLKSKDDYESDDTRFTHIQPLS